MHLQSLSEFPWLSPMLGLGCKSKSHYDCVFNKHLRWCWCQLVWEPLEIILMVKTRISQFLAQLVDYNCGSEMLEEVLGVIDKIWIYIISTFLRFNFLSEKGISAPWALIWVIGTRGWSQFNPAGLYTVVSHMLWLIYTVTHTTLSISWKILHLVYSDLA